MILYAPPIEANGAACFDVRQAQSLRPCCDGSGCYFESPGEFGFGYEFLFHVIVLSCPPKRVGHRNKILEVGRWGKASEKTARLYEMAGVMCLCN